MAIQQQQQLPIPSAYAAEAQDLARAQRMAQMLSSQQMPEGQMISGRFVAPSWTQQLAGLVNAGTGAYFANQAENKQLKLAEKLRQDQLMTQQGIMEAIDKGDTKKALSIASTRPEFGKDFIAPLMANVIPKAPTPPAPTTEMQNFMFAKERGEIPENMGFLGYQKYIKQLSKDTDTQDNMSMVNNNGMPVGRFDKTGRYISPQGRVFPAATVNEAQKEHDVTMDLTNKLNNLTKGDIKNAFGSVMDYTGSKVGQMVGRKDVVDAQNKINSIQIKNVLDNLSQLKGASSDKEMAQMIKDFPAYTADPVIMERWTDRAAKTANRFLKRSEQRFGFDTEYAQEDRFAGNKEKDRTVTKTGVVQDGPNKGRRIVQYSDGTTEYK
jgi:hypothetical protein